ncbi:facilitated trehalose transporter Tret1-like [Phymastichus coffea]|uniref:facilitated trehalose transporter Tret1-like n=1 Tax=Phymastichus coffea TaxID=108790 RepID=UPI00273BF248|nr:facilitated trehalose transporter Tret1-like [Phymastichus coffea]
MLKSIKTFAFPQWLASLGVFLIMLQFGIMGGSMSPTMMKLMASDSSIEFYTYEASWFASLINVGRIFGALCGSIATVYLGTKRTVFWSIIPIALGWFGIALATDINILYIARVSTGIGVGIAVSSYPLYLGEIAIPNIRGSLVSFANFGMSVGQLLGSIVSTYLDVTEAMFIYFGICVFLMAMFFFLPESPHHLVKVGNQNAAEKSIIWYRSGINVDEEFNEVKMFVASESNIDFWDRLREFKNSGTRRAAYQVITLFAFMQINGLNSILYYLEIILKKAQLNFISSSELVIYLNVCAAISSIISIFLIDRYGRKFLLLLSSTGVTIALTMLACHFLLIDMNIDVTKLQWLPVLSLVLYMLFFFVGLITIPSTIMSEIIPSNVKCIVACIGSFTAGLFSFISTKTYQPMVDSMGETFAFLVYAFLTVIIIPYAIFVMRETKGKSLQQIQDELTK